MKKLTTKILSFILVLLMMFSLTVPAFAMEQNSFDVDEPQYRIIKVEETSYGAVHHVQKTNGAQSRTLWDLVDVLMAGASWAKLLSEPSWGNFGWAVLDTAVLLPVLSSTAYFREGGKVILKADEVAKFAKTSAGKKAVSAAMKTYKLASVTYDTKQLQAKFKHAVDFGINGNYSVAKANELKMHS